MNEETKEEIKVVLMLLKGVLTKHGVSMGLGFRGKEIMFFDTQKYLDEKKFSGFVVKTDDLVK